MRHFFRQHWRLLLLTLVVIFLFWIIYLLLGTIFAFLLGLILAYLVIPVIQWLEKKIHVRDRWRKPVRLGLILGIFLVMLLAVALVIYYTVVTFSSAVGSLLANAPDFINSAIETVQGWLSDLRGRLPEQFQQQIDQYLQNAGSLAGNAVQNLFQFTLNFIPSTVGIVVGLVTLPIFLIFVLLDYEKLASSFYNFLPPWVATHTRNIIAIIGKVLGQYVRTQLVLGVTVGVLVLIGLLIMRVQFAFPLGIVAGITELIPILGPWLGGAAGVIVALATEPSKVIWVAVLYVIVQQLENQLLVPRIQSSYLHIHPAVILVLLALGAHFAGIWGLILIVPVTSTLLEIYKYMAGVIRQEDRPPPTDTPGPVTKA